MTFTNTPRERRREKLPLQRGENSPPKGGGQPRGETSLNKLRPPSLATGRGSPEVRRKRMGIVHKDIGGTKKGQMAKVAKGKNPEAKLGLPHILPILWFSVKMIELNHKNRATP